MIGGSARVVGLGLKSKSRDIQVVDEHINNADCAVLVDVIINAFGKEGGLIPASAFNESLHRSPRCRKATFYSPLGFSHSLDP